MVTGSAIVLGFIFGCGQAAAGCKRLRQKAGATVQPYAASARMVRSEAELDAWLGEVRQAAQAKLKSGPVQF